MRKIVQIINYAIALSLIIEIAPSCQTNQSQNVIGNSSSGDKAPVDDNQSWIRDPDGYHIDFEKCLDTRRDLYLSDIAESIEYIALETTPLFMIGEDNVRVVPYGDWLFISEHNKPIGMFDRSGKFIRTIGAIGRGPDEFNHDYRFWHDPTRDILWVWNAYNGSIMGFSHNGDFLHDIRPEYRPGAFAPLGINSFVCWTYHQQIFQEKHFRVFYHNEKGETTGRVFEEKQNNTNPGYILSPLLVPTHGGFLYNPWSDKGVFIADSTGGFVPLLTWEYGKYKLPFDPLSDMNRFRKESSGYIIDVSACEGRSKIYIRYSTGNKWSYAILEKITGEYYIPGNPDTREHGLINDIDGGPSFWPYIDGDGGSVFINLIQAYDLLSGQSRNPMKPSDEEAAAMLESLKEKLTDNSNPVVMLVKVK